MKTGFRKKQSAKAPDDRTAEQSQCCGWPSEREKSPYFGGGYIDRCTNPQCPEKQT